MEKIRKGKKKLYYVLLGLLFALAMLVTINFIPTFNLKTEGMSVYQGKWVDVYYEEESAAAKDVFEYADSSVEQIAKKLGFDEKQPVRIFIYDSQKTMQRKKYGLVGSMLGLDWYIGDNIGTDVLLTSPANPGPVHTYDDNKYAVLHEIVHAYVSVLNPKIHLWLTEGCALYLANGQEFNPKWLEYMSVPSYEDTQTRSHIRFEKCGGYSFANTYIEFLDKNYGWEKVLQLIETENYVNVFGKTDREVYEEWVAYIKNLNVNNSLAYNS